ncbi:30S ribosomal protein S15 [Candidatus Nitrosotenuis chungbukensis]|uniref:30S ribosomal protein S15 n=1 Tax=Candidatus Nitrosotenuis TaxID=1825023 RepID=UPI0005B2C893|nr:MULTISPECIES: 30S ribosomal protein S15 [Nitrosotenuis]QLH09506.1 30S ribosomal protein S15 [Candidatus Nitrosotenuis sp. DW1]WKT58137.1 30S ribosomal protein S15 [Candidatus Nitrosotenuis chungbukensis]
MGRVHTHRHGQSHSTRPITQRTPSWLSMSQKEVEDLVVKYGKDGVPMSQIGIRMRDQHAIPLVKPIVKKSIKKILDDNGVTPEIPEDLNNIVRKAVGLQKHLKTHNSDKRNVRSLELVEAKVHRISTYYKRIGALPENWKYKSVVAQLE